MVSEYRRVVNLCAFQEKLLCSIIHSKNLDEIWMGLGLSFPFFAFFFSDALSSTDNTSQ